MSRFLDERGRIFGKVNVVDILVLLVIIAIVSFVVVRLAGNGSQSVPVEVTYTVESVRRATVNALQNGVKTNAAARDDGGTLLGQVKQVVVTPTLEEDMTPQGELKAFESPIFSDLTIVVQGQARVSGSGLRIGSVPLLVGHKVVLTGGGYEFQSTIMVVNRLK